MPPSRLGSWLDVGVFGAGGAIGLEDVVEEVAPAEGGHGAAFEDENGVADDGGHVAPVAAGQCPSILVALVVACVVAAQHGKHDVDAEGAVVVVVAVVDAVQLELDWSAVPRLKEPGEPFPYCWY